MQYLFSEYLLIYTFIIIIKYTQQWARIAPHYRKLSLWNRHPSVISSQLTPRSHLREASL